VPQNGPFKNHGHEEKASTVIGSTLGPLSNVMRQSASRDKAWDIWRAKSDAARAKVS
jgi:hypothetical protein